MTTRSEQKRQGKLAALDQVARNADYARQEVERAIRIAHAAGASLRDIAKAAGISHEQVRRILARTD